MPSGNGDRWRELAEDMRRMAEEMLSPNPRGDAEDGGTMGAQSQDRRHRGRTGAQSAELAGPPGAH